MRELSIDIETYSDRDLTRVGVYAYADSPAFRILLFAYAFDDGPVQIVDFEHGEKLPDTVVKALTDPEIIKTAYNANFERVCISVSSGFGYFRYLPPEQWRCTAVAASELGLPNTLDGVAQALHLSFQKDKRGKDLINYFCKPNPKRESNQQALMDMDAEKWEEFKEYCKQDVEVERAIKKKISRFPIPESEQKLWELDQRINDRGICIDEKLVENAISFSGAYVSRAAAQFSLLTGIENPKSVVQIKNWLKKELGEDISSADKKALAELRARTMNPRVKEVLRLRALIAKSSVSKYEAMKRSLCDDGRIRGTMQFYGANRTGRWAGRIIQPQNFPQNHLPDLKEARETLKEGNLDWFETLYGDVTQVLSELIRTAIIPKSGHRFIVSDFSAIEARIIAYLADENWRIKLFKDNGDIYCSSASQMFKVPVVKNGVNGHLRQKGKIAELACGYDGGVGALKAMGALEMGLEESELQPIVDKWRNSNPHITEYWRTVETAAVNAINDKPSRIAHGISFQKRANILFVTLPSGRKIAYVKPRIGENKFGGQSICYMGLDTAKHWTELETWGGKLVENIVQAVARDCLAESLKRLEKVGYRAVFHVHDEVIIEAPEDFGSLEDVTKIMSQPMPWTEGLPLNAAGFECEFYQKD